MQLNSKEKNALTRKDAVVFILFFGSFCLASIIYVLLQKDFLLVDSYLIRDWGVTLAVSDALLSGDKLYQEIFWHYGPISILYYAQWGKLFGNDPIILLLSLVPIYALNTGLAFLILRKEFPLRTSIFGTLLVITPFFLHQTGGSHIYVPFEMLLLLTLMLIYAPPLSRDWRRSIALGLVLGLMQWNKFGGAFFVGAALALTDLLALHLDQSHLRGKFKPWLQSNLIILATFLSCEAIRATLCFSLLEPKIASDVFFPLYHLDTYSRYVTKRFDFYFEGVIRLFCLQIPLLIMLVSGVMAVLFSLLRKPQSSVIPLRCALLVLFYVIALFKYFQHTFLIYDNLWVLVIPFAAILPRLKLPLRAALFAVLIPPLALIPYEMTLQKNARSPLVMPNGATLWMKTEHREEALLIRDALQDMPSSDKAVLFFGTSAGRSTGGGFYHYFQLNAATRHRWFLPGFMRPYEEEKILTSLDGTRALVVLANTEVISKMTPDPTTWSIEVWSPFTPANNPALISRLDAPHLISDQLVIFPIKKNAPVSR